MQRRSAVCLILVLLLSPAATVRAGLLDKAKDYRRGLKRSASEPDVATVIAGLKEALSVGTANAVASVSRVNGYFGNAAIKIPLPEKIRSAANTLSSLGMQKQVDEFVLSMNRAAERAAPRAKELFIDAVKQMTFQDARSILTGNDTAATDYLKARTSDQLAAAFTPIVSAAMNDVGVTRAYKRLMDKAISFHLVRAEDVDLTRHVTTRALEGLFRTVGEEEKKIRKDPAARVTELLKKVFAQKA